MRTGAPLPPCVEEQAILSLIEDNPRQAMQLVMNLFNIFLPAITELQTIVNGRIGKDNLALDNWLIGDPWVKVGLNLQKPQQAMRVRHARPHHGLDQVGGDGKHVKSLQIDGRGHVGSWAEADNAAAEKAHTGDAWVVVNDAGASTAFFSHGNPQATANTFDVTNFHFNAVTQIQTDAKGHVSAGTAGGFDANEHLTFDGTNLNHNNVGATASTLTPNAGQSFNFISVLAIDAKGHVVKADSNSAGVTAANHLTLTGSSLSHDPVGASANTIAVGLTGTTISIEIDQWGHVVNFFETA